jgi:hypothetical protein
LTFFLGGKTSKNFNILVHAAEPKLKTSSKEKKKAEVAEPFAMQEYIRQFNQYWSSQNAPQNLLGTFENTDQGKVVNPEEQHQEETQIDSSGTKKPDVIVD